MLAGNRIFVRVRFPVFILMCLSDAFVVKCDKISIEARLKEAVIVDFLGNSSSVFTDTMADGSEGVAHRDKLLDNVSVFKLKVFVFRCSHDKPPVKDA